MKAKTFNKKLILKKETVSNLNNAEMMNVIGGTGESSQCTVCFTCWNSCHRCALTETTCPTTA